MARPRKIENYFNSNSKTKFTEPSGKSKGILDDHAVRKNISTKEGDIQRIAKKDTDITSKNWVNNNRIADFTIPIKSDFDEVNYTYNNNKIAQITFKDSGVTTVIVTVNSYTNDGNFEEIEVLDPFDETTSTVYTYAYELDDNNNITKVTETIS